MTNLVVGVPFIVAGLCKSLYDVSLFALFRNSEHEAEEREKRRMDARLMQQLRKLQYEDGNPERTAATDSPSPSQTLQVVADK